MAYGQTRDEAVTNVKTLAARPSVRAGKGIPWDEVEAEDDKRTKPSRARRKRRG